VDEAPEARGQSEDGRPHREAQGRPECVVNLAIDGAA
jgi:hypothetical protein